MKTLSNYVNHIAGTPLDEAFSAVAWSPEEESDAPQVEAAIDAPTTVTGI